MTKHYHGDDSNLKVLVGGLLKSFGNMTVEAFEKMVADFMHQTQHPSLGISYMEVAFTPMVELLRYLEANDFTTYFMIDRSVSGDGLLSRCKLSISIVRK